LIQLLCLKNMRLDEQVSDTRAIAIMIALVGEVALSLYSSKFVLVQERRRQLSSEDTSPKRMVLVSSPLRWEVDFGGQDEVVMEDMEVTA
jgi:hypothetical protein